MAKTAIAKKSIDGTVVKWEFTNDTTIELDIAQCSDEIKTRLACHGASQKGGDSYAGVSGDVSAAVAACQRVVDDLLAGNWTTRTAGSGPRVTLLAEALARVGTEQTGREVTIEEALTVLDNLDDDAKKSLRADPQIKAITAQIKLERAERDAAAAQGAADGADSPVSAMFS